MTGGWGSRAPAAALLLAVAVLTGGCRVGTDPETVPRPTPTVTVTRLAEAPLPTLPVPSAPHRKVPTGVWARGGVIHVDGSSVDVSPLRVDRVVATQGGVFFLSNHELWALSGRRASFTGYSGLHRLAVSSDGRYLGLVDRHHGPGDVNGNRQALVVVLDTDTGRVVHRWSRGMGTRGQDLAALYAAHPPHVLDFRGSGSDLALRVRTPSGVLGYPVHGGEPVPMPPG